MTSRKSLGELLRRGASGLMGSRGTTRRTVTRNATWKWALGVGNALVFFFVSPFIVGTLGNASYGVWVLIQTLSGYLSLANLGIQPAIVHFIARNDAVGDAQEVNRYASSGFFTFLISGGFALACALGIAGFLPSWFSVPEDLSHSAQLAFLIAATSLAVSMPMAAISAVNVGKQRYDVSCQIGLGALLIRTVLIVAALVLDGGLVGLALADLAGNVLSLSAQAVAAFRLQPTLRISPRLVDWAHAKGLLAYGIFNVVNMIASRLSYATDAFVIGASMSLSWVTYFSVGARLPFRLGGLIADVGMVLSPTIGALHGVGDSQRIARIVTRAARLVVMLAAPATVYFLLLGGAFLERWMGGADFRINSGPVLAILAVSQLASISTIPLTTYHQGVNQMRPLAMFAITAGVSNLAISIALVGPLGIVGVALGTAIPSVVVGGLAMPWWACRRLELPFARYLLDVWLAPILAAGATLALMAVYVDSSASHGWPWLIVHGITCTVVYAALLALLILGVRSFRRRRQQAGMDGGGS